MAVADVPWRLDHASVAVPDLPAAIEHLDRRLGLRATVTPEAPDRHSRVFLDRSYLEVSADAGSGGWGSTLFFLRFDDPAALRAHLDDALVPYRFSEYEGVDGVWDDVEVTAGDVPLPILVRRTAPEAVAREWPPALIEAHPCGARALAAVHVEVPSLDAAVDTYRSLLGGEGVSEPNGNKTHATVRLASGEIVLREGASDAGLGLVLGVPSLSHTRTALGERLAVTDDVAWLDPGDTFGLRLGFTEA